MAVVFVLLEYGLNLLSQFIILPLLNSEFVQGITVNLKKAGYFLSMAWANFAQQDYFFGCFSSAVTLPKTP